MLFKDNSALSGVTAWRFELETHAVSSKAFRLLLVMLAASALGCFANGQESSSHGSECAKAIVPEALKEPASHNEVKSRRLGIYLDNMSRKLNFYYTTEDILDRDPKTLRIRDLEQSEPDASVESIETFVAHLNRSLAAR